jgi:predicted acyl esterase
MWGCSATGGSQMQALTVAPPHLKAIFPMSCEFDVYPFGVPGGMAASSGDTKAPPGASSGAARDAMAEPVDGDTGGAMLREAVAQHAMNVENPGYAPFRDSVAANIPEVWWAKSSPHTYWGTVSESGIAVYAAANWDEAATKYGAFFTYNNLTTPRRLIVGPKAHCAWFDVQSDTGFDLLVEEAIRWPSCGLPRRPTTATSSRPCRTWDRRVRSLLTTCTDGCAHRSAKRSTRRTTTSACPTIRSGRRTPCR